jgi:hypothetical protein
MLPFQTGKTVTQAISFNSFTVRANGFVICPFADEEEETNGSDLFANGLI